MKLEQVFKKYDHVRITDALDDSMSHFPSGQEAIVIGSYADQFGGSNVDSYTLHIKGRGEVSWYQTRQLTLIAHNCKALLSTWADEAEKKSKQQSDLDWIFENDSVISKGASGATVEALAKCMGITNLWGNRGEGFVYYMNSMTALNAAASFIKAKDKAGWLEFCSKRKAKE
jgi:hypothetical protein